MHFTSLPAIRDGHRHRQNSAMNGALKNAGDLKTTLVLAGIAGLVAAFVGNNTGDAIRLFILAVGGVSLVIIFFKIELGVYLLTFSVVTNLSHDTPSPHGKDSSLLRRSINKHRVLI